MRALVYCVGVAAAMLSLGGCGRGSGLNFDARVEHPAFEKNARTMLFDAGHHNRHAISSTYRPFAELLRNDGLQVKELKSKFTPSALAPANILAVVCAKSEGDTSAESAFAGDEVQAVTEWIRAGGSLLLIVDHYPFPNAAESMLRALGLEAAKGMTFDPVDSNLESRDDSRLIFRRSNGLLAAHPITDGRDASERVEVVETFTGDAIFPRAEGIVNVLKLGPHAVNRVGTPVVEKDGGATRVTVKFGDPTPANGWSQCVAFELGRGRVVVAAEAAMWTAQADGGRFLGMNAAGNNNRQFVLNTARWLGRVF